MPEQYSEGDACPHCGAERLGATIKSHGVLYVNDGIVIDWDERHAGETLQIQCLECDKMLMDKLNGEVTHSLEVGDYTLDAAEPTPSPEANTVEVIELTGKRADEVLIEETDKTVAEHNPHYPPDDPVVVGVYPNMSPDKEWHFPESRLREV